MLELVIALIVLFFLAVFGVIGLLLMIYGLFFEKPESPKKYWAEVIIGGILANVTGIGMAVVIALIT
jgi:hypothetical protein